MAISLEQYLAEAWIRDQEYARKEDLNNNWWMNLDFLDQVWKLRQCSLSWCSAIDLDI